MRKQQRGNGVRLIALFAILSLISTALAATVGAVDLPEASPDPSYGATGTAVIPATSPESASSQVEVTQSGAAWVLSQGSSSLFVTRLAPDGSTVGNWSTSSDLGFSVRLIVQGEAVLVVLKGRIVKLGADVSPDTGFGDGGTLMVGTDGEPNDLGLAIAGCYVCGMPLSTRIVGDKVMFLTRTIIDGVEKPMLVSVNSDGSIDATFGNSGVLLLPDLPNPYTVSNVASFFVDSSARVTVVDEKLAFRITADGVLDGTYGSAETPGFVSYEGLGWYCVPTGPSPRPCSTVSDVDGRVYVAARRAITIPMTSGVEFGIFSLEANGTSPEFHKFCSSTETSPLPGGGCWPASNIFIRSVPGLPDRLMMATRVGLVAASLPLAPGSLTVKLIATPGPTESLNDAVGGPTQNTAVALFRNITAPPGTPAPAGLVRRLLLDVAPKLEVSPPSGTFAVGDDVTIDFECPAPCYPVLVEGEIPDPLPAGWSPGSGLLIQDGYHLETWRPTVFTFIMLTVEMTPNGYQMSELNRARYEVLGEPIADGVHASFTQSFPSTGSDFVVGEQTAKTWFWCQGGAGYVPWDCYAQVADGVGPRHAPAGTPIAGWWGEAPLPTQTPGTRTIYVGGEFVPDGDTSRSVVITEKMATYNVYEGFVDFVDTDRSPSSGSDLSASDPFIISASVHEGSTDAYDLRALEIPESGTPPAGYAYLPWGMRVIDERPFHSDEPSSVQYDVSFDASLLGGKSASQIQAFFGGVRVPDCDPGVQPVASPDPCVLSRAPLPGAGAKIVLFSSQFGSWSFGSAAGPVTEPGAPTAVVAEPGVKKAMVSWSVTDDGGAPITRSVITATPVAGSIDPTTGNPATVRTKYLTGSETSGSVALSTGVAYDITVKCRNGTVSRYGPESDPVRVSPFALPGVPSGVTAVGGVRSLVVEWSPPSSDSPLTGYTVVATPVDGVSPVVSKSVSGAVDSYTVKGLLNGTSYTVTVAAKSAVGVSDPSVSSPVATTAALPGAPDPVMVSAGPGSAVLSWSDASSDDRFPLTKYVVKLTATRADGTIHSVTKSVPAIDGAPPVTELTVTGLVPGLVYSVVLSATNAAGTGPTSVPVEVAPFLGISVSDATKVEGTASTPSSMGVTVRLSSLSDTDVTFLAWTRDGTATAPGDYLALSPTLFTIPAGKRSVTVPVKIVRDSIQEPDETLELIIAGASGATITRDSATLTITNDD